MSNLKLPNMSYSNLSKLVPGTEEVKLAYATTARRSEHDEQAIEVLHHSNLIAVLFPTFIRLSNGGWDSQTTSSRLNWIVRNNGVCGHVSLCKGDTILTVDGESVVLNQPIAIDLPPKKKRRGIAPLTAMALVGFAAMAIAGCSDNGSTATATHSSPAVTTVTQTPFVNALPTTTEAPGANVSPEQRWIESLIASGFVVTDSDKATMLGRIICQMKLEEQSDAVVIRKINGLVADTQTAAGRGDELLSIAERTICKGYQG